jgi:hypothetical protein
LELYLLGLELYLLKLYLFGTFLVGHRLYFSGQIDRQAVGLGTRYFGSRAEPQRFQDFYLFGVIKKLQSRIIG